ncbi:hypothetical protein LSH36_403g02012 [Paralvinella palmiformis]|uniref:Uncharacterized protein n=1 Tax=Paralvinella palmiformis TaxID=53620 RepID=A0AAD9JD87_9ANNE|nr:hypothetical protein LSH36_403g02012 [Paralvinella palmiformis]
MASEEDGYKVVMYDDIVECHIPASAFVNRKRSPVSRQSEDCAKERRTDDLFNGNVPLQDDVNVGLFRDEAGISSVNGDGSLCHEKKSLFIRDADSSAIPEIHRIVGVVDVGRFPPKTVENTSKDGGIARRDDIGCIMEKWEQFRCTGRSVLANDGDDDDDECSNDEKGVVADDFQWLVPVNIEVRSTDSGSDFLRDSSDTDSDQDVGYELVPSSLSWETVELLELYEAGVYPGVRSSLWLPNLLLYGGVPVVPHRLTSEWRSVIRTGLLDVSQVATDTRRDFL